MKENIGFTFGLSKKTYVIVAGLLIVTSLVPIWIGEFFPNQNGPLYLLIIHMIKEFSNPAFNYSDYFDVLFVLVPNLSFHIIVYLLSYLFPILTSYKIAISMNLILFPLSIFYFIKAIDSKKIIFGFLSFIYIYNYFLFKGYDSFLFSISVFFFFFGYLIKYHNRMNKKDWFILFTLSFLLYFSHIFTFLIAIFLTTIYIFIHLRDRLKIIKIMTVFIPGLLFFLQYFIHITQHSDALVSDKTHWLNYEPIHWSIQRFIEMDMYSYTQLTVLIFLIPFSYVVYSIVRHMLDIKNNYSILSRDGIMTLISKETFLLFFLLLSVMFFIMPREIAGWPKFNTRIIPFVFVFALVSVKPITSKVVNRIFLTIVIAMSISLYSLMGYYIFNIQKKMDDYMSGISVIENNKTLLPVDIEEYKVGEIKPLNWAFNYYNIFKGGATNRCLAYVPGRVPVLYKQPVEEILPSFYPNKPEKADFDKIKEAYDYVLFWGENQEIFTLFEEKGFKLIHQKGQLRLYKNNRS